MSRRLPVRDGSIRGRGHFPCVPGIRAVPASTNGDTVVPALDGYRRRRVVLVARRGAHRSPRVTASPISWEGQGPIVWVSHDRGSRSRQHHFEGSFASAGGFELRSPVATKAAPDDDGVSRFSGRYEYRQYFWRDLWTDGFDLGIGVEGSGEHLSFDRHFAPDILLERA